MEQPPALVCHCPPATPHHPCAPDCPVQHRHYSPACWGDGAIVGLVWADANGQLVHHAVGILETPHGLRCWRLDLVNVPDVVLRCLSRWLWWVMQQEARA